MRFCIVLVTSLLFFASSAMAALEIDSNFLKSMTGSSSVSMPVENLIEIIRNVRLDDNSHPKIIGWTRKNNIYTFTFKTPATIKLTFVHLLNSGGSWSSISATSDGKPVDAIALIFYLNAMPRDKTKSELQVSEKQRKEKSGLNENFYFPKTKGIYTEKFGYEDESTRTVNIREIYNGKVDFDYISKLNNENICVVPVRGASLIQSKEHKHKIEITSEGKCQIKLDILTAIYEHPERDEMQTHINVKHRGNCDEYCDFGKLTEYYDEGDRKEWFYPTSSSMKDVKFEEMMAKKRKEAEASSWK